MSEPNKTTDLPPERGWQAELGAFWRQLPDRWLFVILASAWLAFFHFLGNPERGYTNTSSLFVWAEWVYGKSADDAHGRLMPLVVLGLLWWKREDLLAVPKGNWWPAIALVGLALVLHVLGFMVQQARVCMVAFAVGLYGLMGVVWGWRWLRASFFPFFLLGFSVPISSPIQGITFPMRLMATRITVFFIQSILGMNVIQDGTRIFDAEGRFSYEIEAACSGLRSLIATVALATIYGFMNFKSPFRRLTMIALAFPLAVAGNVLRLCLIMIVAEAFGQEAGNYVHDNSWLSLLPYVPALVGIGVAGHFLREDRGTKPVSPAPVNLTEEQAA